LRETSDQAVEPLPCRFLVIDVAIHAIVDAPGSEFLEAGVESFAGLAELRVVGVAECEDGELDVIESRRAAVPERVPERLRIVGHVAFAIGARDNANAFLGRDVHRAVLLEAQRARVEAALFRIAGKASGEALRGTCLGSKEEKQ